MHLALQTPFSVSSISVNQSSRSTPIPLLTSGFEFAIGFVEHGRLGAQQRSMGEKIGIGDEVKFRTDIASVKLMYVRTDGFETEDEVEIPLISCD